MPLADRIRPQNLDEVVGQEHLLKKGSVFRTLIESGHVPYRHQRHLRRDRLGFYQRRNSPIH